MVCQTTTTLLGESAMKILFVDLETTGVNSREDDILEIGAILYDCATKEKLLMFHAYVKHKTITLPGDLLMKLPGHVEILSKCQTDGNNIEIVKDSWKEWLSYATATHGKLVFGGKNPNFDRSFLSDNRFSLDGLGFRMFDIGSWMVDVVEDVNIPSLQDCLARVGVDKNVEHTALADCLDCITILEASL
jgi:DNA polymerase III epsilon subunit-like protein